MFECLECHKKENEFGKVVEHSIEKKHDKYLYDFNDLRLRIDLAST